jgi:hypothetical protein
MERVVSMSPQLLLRLKGISGSIRLLNAIGERTTAGSAVTLDSGQQLSYSPLKLFRFDM